MVADLLRVAGALVLLALLGVLLLAALGRGPIGREVARRARVRGDDLVRLAEQRGWTTARDAEVDRAWDDRFTAARGRPVRCDLVVDGGAEGFVAESWVVNGPGVGGNRRQHFLRLPCPDAGDFVVRGLPSKAELALFPARFRDRSGFVQFHTQVLVGGDFAHVQDRLAPYVEAIEASRAWVLGAGDELVLMSAGDPDPRTFELRLALGKELVRALGDGDPVEKSSPGD